MRFARNYLMQVENRERLREPVGMGAPSHEKERTFARNHERHQELATSANPNRVVMNHSGFAELMVARISEDQRPFEVRSSKLTVLSHFGPSGAWNAVEAQAVGNEVYLVKQSALQSLHLGELYLAFEHRLLHALAGAFTDFRNTAQTSSTGPCFGVHVVADQYQHRGVT